MKRKRNYATVAGLALVVAASIPLGSQEVTAADHTDGTAEAADDGAADIGDVYAWTTMDGDIVLVMTFAGPFAPDATERYNRDKLYTFHIDNTGDPALANTYDDPLPSDETNDLETDMMLHVRFGENALGEWGVRFEGVPGCDDPTDGPVDMELGDGAACRLQAGTFDDPFFFDLIGFQDTINSLGVVGEEDTNIKFDTVDMDPQAGPTDFFAGMNIHAIIIQIPADTLGGVDMNTYLNIWGQTGTL